MAKKAKGGVKAKGRVNKPDATVGELAKVRRRVKELEYRISGLEGRVGYLENPDPMDPATEIPDAAQDGMVLGPDTLPGHGE